MKPVLLLIPGMFNTTDIWRYVVQALQEEADIRVLDVTTQSSLLEMAADAWSLVKEVPTETPITVCGYSMGGYVALELLAAHAQDIHALAMVDSSAGVENADSLLVREKTIAALEKNFDRTVEGVIGYSLHLESQKNAALVADMRSMMHQVGAATAIRQTQALMVRRDHTALLQNWKKPALIVCGRDDKVTPPALSTQLGLLLPHAPLAWIENAGHQTPVEQPALVAQHLRALMRL
jgi:pimeloyl-ACP methyl ester carboxylesterase